MTAPIIIDPSTVECVVGRVRDGNEWGAIDRSRDIARMIFVDLMLLLILLVIESYFSQRRPYYHLLNLSTKKVGNQLIHCRDLLH